MNDRHGTATIELRSESEVVTRRSFDAPRARVFDAISQPEQVRHWFSADRTPLHICEIDLRVGGNYHFAWYAPNGVECTFRGYFLEIERPTRIVQTWTYEGWPDDGAVETLTLAEDDGVTTMTSVLRFADAARRGDHFQGDTQGVQNSYDQLEDLLAGQPPR
ncbi:MAG: SRPBCC domain-containing protein [Acidobacteria bacterium]|nr:SRPBCC domain-containing protein [Acidobacteriota bacterium]